MRLRARAKTILSLVATTSLAATGATLAGTGVAHAGSPSSAKGGASGQTATPIKHLVVIFQENVSFDHYFGTYPHAANPPGSPPFHARPGTPSVNGLSGSLLTRNPNRANPQRLDRAQALTCDQNHGYTAEQQAFDHGLMDHFVQDTGHGLTLSQCLKAAGNPAPVHGSKPNKAVMDYYDGNTVTALWHYAQHFAMSDNAYGTTFGPSTPGALNVTAGNTYGADCGPAGAVSGPVPACPATPATTTGDPTHKPTAAGPGTVYSDRNPYYDMCSAGHGPTIKMGGKNVGDLLNAKGVTWGWFQGGFAGGYVPGRGQRFTPAAACTQSHTNIGGHKVVDYIPHHEPFQYFASTANPRHLPPTSVAAIGHTDQANHQYGMGDFWAVADAGNLPAVSYLKAPGYQDGHAGYSDPLDEQHFLVKTINRLERLPSWRSTAVVITYDDSDGWYDHQLGPVVTQSQTSHDALSGPGACGTNPAQVPRTDTGAPEEARCGLGPRLPFLVISPYARANAVSGHLIDQTSVVSFIENNWHLGRIGNGSADRTAGSLSSMLDVGHPANSRLFLDPRTGEVTHGRRGH